MFPSIEVILDNIFISLNQPDALFENASLKRDILLFKFIYFKYRNIIDQQDLFAEGIQDLAERTIAMNEVSICSGRAGAKWFMIYLSENGLIDEEDIELICNDDISLGNISLKMIKDGNYDFLHGSLGIAYYLLKRNENWKQTFFAEYFVQLNLLKSKSISGNVIPGYDLLKGILKPDEVNFGMAHGLISVIKFCIQCYRQGVCREEAQQLAEYLISYMLDNKNRDSSKSFFPYAIYENKSGDSYSRLAWCYGDLSIGYIFYEAALLFNNKDVEEFALKVLKHCSGRTDLRLNQIYDAGFCHGSAGVAHIFNRMWHKTGDVDFSIACDYWINATISFSKYENGVGGFKAFTNIGGVYENNYTMLEGGAGIGMVLYSYLTGDFSWDYCLMLN